MAKNVGIDLGTTNSVCCRIENGQFKFLKFGSRELLPSALMYKDGKITVGEKARRKAVINPENYIESSKTFMGDSKKFWNIDDRNFTPTETAAEILREIRSECVNLLGDEDINAVITVPAYFTSNQIDETKKAGEAAGFKVKRIISEPIAAAVAYGFEENEDQMLYVVDIGGGTFDVSILKVKGRNFSSIGIGGDKKLGGDDFDNILMDIFFSAIRKSAGVDLSSLDKSGLSLEEYYPAKQKLRIEAEKCKIELSSAENYEVEIPELFKNVVGPFNFSFKISRSEFEEASKQLFNKIKKGIKDLIELVKYKPDKIDKVILVGGTAYIPMIRNFVRDFFGKEPYSDKDLAKLVAMGAALIADDQENKITVRDIISHSLGIKIVGNKFEKILYRGDQYPVEKTKTFTTEADHQKIVNVEVYEGEDTDNVYANEYYGNFTHDKIENAKAGVPKIDVTFNFDKNRILSITAADRSSGSSKNIKLAIDKSIKKESEKREKKDKKTARYDIVLLIDQSGSMTGRKITEAKKSCRELIDKMIDFSSCEVGLIAFQTSVTVLSALSKDTMFLLKKIKSIRAMGGTNIKDALGEAEVLFEKSRNNRLIILFTDGQPDIMSSTTKKANLVKKSGIRIITIGIGEDAADSYLEKIASQKSDYYFVKDISGLSGVFKTIVDGLRLA